MTNQLLILDDDDRVRGLLRFILEKAGYDCLDAASDEEAWKILNSKHIDLVIQDMRRGSGDGCTFVRLLRSNCRLSHIPILIVSGDSKRVAAESFALAGVDFDENVDGYLTKPWDNHELLAKIQEILTKARVLKTNTGRKG